MRILDTIDLPLKVDREVQVVEGARSWFHRRPLPIEGTTASSYRVEHDVFNCAFCANTILCWACITVWQKSAARELKLSTNHCTMRRPFPDTAGNRVGV